MITNFCEFQNASAELFDHVLFLMVLVKGKYVDF